MLRAVIASSVLLAFATGCSDRKAETPPPTMTVTYSVEGMHCENCVAAITAKAKDVPGVVACDVSLDEKRMIVAVDDPAAKQRVAEAVAKLGYAVTIR